MRKKVIVIDDETSILDAFREILAPDTSKASLDEISTLTAELTGDLQPGANISFSETYDLVCACRGEDGFKLVSDALEAGQSFHVAFIDVRMPGGWDGIETATKIRALDPYIEIVIVTAFSDRSQQEIVETVGTPEKLLYLRKPFDSQEIRQVALSLTRKWELEYKHRKHLEYLEKLLNSVRRLKTLGISSVKDVLLAILNELLIIVNAQNGIVINMDNGSPLIEIVSDSMTRETAEELTLKIEEKLSNVNVTEITAFDGVLVFPLKNEAGTYLVLILSTKPIVDEEKRNLLKLFIETASEVLLSVNQQEQFIRSEKIATIGQVAAGIIHEINNPLSSLVTLIQPSGLMKKKLDMIDKTVGNHSKITNEISRYLEIASMATQHITSIVTSMRGMTGANRTVFQVQDARRAIDDALILANNTLRKKGIKVYRDYDRPLVANCDMNGLKQVFLNLILNAAQAMDNNGELWLSGQAAKDRLYIYVKDNGPGISKELLESVFKVFYTTKEDGTGLGLSIVKGIVESHQGNVRIESEPGKGTTFHIDIPAS